MTKNNQMYRQKNDSLRHKGKKTVQFLLLILNNRVYIYNYLLITKIIYVSL